MAKIYGQNNYYFTLNGVADGSHSLKIYAKDAAGYKGKSETYFFTVNTLHSPTPGPPHTLPPTLIASPSPTLEPTLTVMAYVHPPNLTGWYILVGLVALVIITAVGAAVYLKKRKREP